MKDSVYKAAKLNIFEKHRNRLISESQRDELFAILEKEKNDSELTDDKVLEILDEMEDKYPDLEDDIEALAKKIKKCSNKNSNSKHASDNEDDSASSVSEAYQSIMADIMNL